MMARGFSVIELLVALTMTLVPALQSGWRALPIM